MPKAVDPPIVFLDSGMGGIPYLEHFRQRYPHIPSLYLADTLHFPYGGKAEEELREILLGLYSSLVQALRPRLTVLACNTASVVALGSLRESFPGDRFVGTVPALKPAAFSSKSRVIAVLATKRTVRDPYLDVLESRFASDCRVLRVEANPLVELIESGAALDGPDFQNIMNPIVREFQTSGVDRVVLGCTHFILAWREISQVLGPGMQLVDSREGITRRIAGLLSLSADPQGLSGSSQTPELILTGPDRAGFYSGMIAQGRLRHVEDVHA